MNKCFIYVTVYDKQPDSFISLRRASFLPFRRRDASISCLPLSGMSNLQRAIPRLQIQKLLSLRFASTAGWSNSRALEQSWAVL